jgi:Protein of unknown function (DUF4239)
MIIFLYSLSDLSVTILFSTMIALIFAAAPFLRMWLMGQISEIHSEIARTTMTTVTGFTGAVLAFSLVQAQGNLRSVEKTVAAEALQLNQMDRLVESFGDKAASIRNAIHAYAVSVVTQEWPKLSEHSRSPQTDDLFRALSQEVLALQPTPGRDTVIFSDLIKSLDQLAESRQDLVSASDLGLPPIFWEVIMFLTLLLVAFCAFLETERALYLGGLGAGLGLLIALVCIFDQPFLGNVSVTPDPIVRMLHVTSTRLG